MEGYFLLRIEAKELRFRSSPKKLEMEKKIIRMKAAKRWLMQEIKKDWWLSFIWFGLSPLKWVAITWVSTLDIDPHLKVAISSLLFFAPTGATLTLFFLMAYVRKRRKERSV